MGVVCRTHKKLVCRDMAGLNGLYRDIGFGDMVEG